MIYVTQGHELSIGPEVFLKAFSLLPDNSKSNFTYIGTQDCLKTQLDFLKIPHSFSGQKLIFLNSTLSCHFIPKRNLPASTQALEAALPLIRKKDILLTLPTSKDKIFYNGKACTGHTDFFRKYYKVKEISMVFSSPEESVLLITDHIPLKDVAKDITEKIIVDKINLTLKDYPKYFHPFEEVLISGINPHAGEGGLLGNEDKKIADAIEKLKVGFKKIKFLGPLSGDSLHFHKNPDKRQLKVYMYHDQGLVSFKARNDVIGLNISLGLPFLRMSVDHGTAFSLYGKNKANCLGCYYLLIKALEVHNGARSNKNK
jgi:4-hydroxythreonine-4-phosphate dehydrogenase